MKKLSFDKRAVLKLLLFMNLKIFFLFMCVMPASASIYSQNTKLDVSVENYSLERVFEQIESQSEFTFLYSVDDVDDYLDISVDIKGKSVEEILEKCLDNTSLTYEVEDKLVVVRQKGISLTPKAAEQEKVKITGSVTENSGESLPGVAVVIKGTTTGSVTDMNGEFTINAKMGDVLVFSFVGMLSQEVVVTGKKVLVVELKVDVANLSEVVVVGFGKQKKESVVGSMTTIKPSELKIPSSNLTTALAGRIAGVISYQTSGEPGKDNAQFFVRGITTFAAHAKPLILIDGVELSADDLARLNPDDIESFSVLKDATSTAVYGARGANGVIYVVTKTGSEGPAKFSIRFENSFSTNTSLPKIANGVTYMNKFNEAVRTRKPSAYLPFSQEKIYNTENNVNSNVFPNVDWQKQLVRDVTRNKRVNLNLRGGGKVVQYYIAGNFSQDHGILKDDPLGNIDNNINLKKYGFRANINAQLSKSLKAVVRFNSTLDNFKGPSVGSGVLFSQTMLTSPVRFPAVYKPDAYNENTPHILFGNEQINGNTYYVNPYQQLVSGYTESSSALSLVQLELTQDLSKFVKGLNVRFVGNSARTSSFSLARNTDPFFYQAMVEDYNPITKDFLLTRLNDDGNRALTFQNNGSSVASSTYGELSLNYQKEWKKHSFSAMAVGIIRESSNSSAGSLIASLPFRNVGISGRATYGYDSKYFAEVNFGYNGSERFAEKNRFGLFPSFGLGWIISKEEWMQSISPNLVSHLKLKASYGVVGNDALGYDKDRFFYQSQVILGVGGTSWGDLENSRHVSGVSIKNYENDQITWEEAKTLNLGLEWDFLDNAVQVRADYFVQNRSNILQTRLLPANVGLKAFNRDNVGEARTTGIDFSIDGNKSFYNGAWIGLRGTFTYATGKVTHFEEPNYALLNSPLRAINGVKINQAYGYVAERLFFDDAEVDNSPSQNFGGPKAMAGDIKYKDINGDNTINDLDKVAIGNPQAPVISYGGGLSFGYKDFDFSIFFQGNAKVSMFIDPKATAPFITGVRKEDQTTNGRNYKTYAHERALLQVYADDHWSEENRNVNALYPRLSSVQMPNNSQQSTWWMRNASFLRLKQIEIGYNLRDIAGIESMRFYASGTNLAVWSKFKMWDPELRGNGFGYPLQKVFNLGVSVNF